MTSRILVGDVRERLRDLPERSVHCVVTSPPYYGLRDYGVAGQIGLESTLAEYITNMVDVFREVRRVLRDDGVCFVNIGDSYAGGGGFSSASPSNQPGGSGFASDRPNLHKALIKGGRSLQGLKTKDLMLVPERLALALQDDGWWVRSRIIWAKKACMPESVTDRPTNAHEHIWLITKSARYFYDAEAVAEDAIEPAPRFGWEERKARGEPMRRGLTPGAMPISGGVGGDGKTRNQRNVWHLGPEPFPDAHFATFPTEIPRRCIKAGCPEGGTVLDPFLGSGTTLMVADQLGRHGIGIELNPEYAAMAERRIRGDAPLFAQVDVA